MTYSQAGALTGFANNPDIDPTTSVWVVTVYAPRATDGGPAAAPVVQPYYTEIFDAASGLETDWCVGCAALGPDAGAGLK